MCHEQLVGDESQEQQTFLFADLAGFTALTEVHGDEEAADLAAVFFEAIRDLLDSHAAHEVKTIGDAVMLSCSDARRAVELGLRIVEEFRAHPDFPAVRVGIHTGPAVERHGDWFGAAVNLAARVSAAASGGQVFLTEWTLNAAGELPRVEVQSEGEQRFRNIVRPTKIYRALRRGERAEDLPIDPVCRMAVDPERAAGQLCFDERGYYFCSLKCAAAFSADPTSYVAP
jgi:class 3 adenylate cyclase/YHS domain-containing protein